MKQIEEQRTERKQRQKKMLEFVRMLDCSDGFLTDFDEGLWNAMVEKVIVQADGDAVFRWRNGMGISVKSKSADST